MDEQLKGFIRDTKQRLRGLHDVKRSYADLTDAVRADVDDIRDRAAKGQSTLPEVTYKSIAENSVTSAQHEAIKKAGAVIVRGVFDRSQAEAWNDELGAYVEDNDFFAKAHEKRGVDKYFSDLDAGTPQIFGLYWSRPQVMARQAETMAVTKRFLNGLWDVAGPMGDEFDPSEDFSYADRTRRRQPGDTTLGLSPHMDSGSFERWLDPAYQRIYGSIFEGHWQDYDPWKATFRTQTREYASPAVCSMFRTFQGWTALTPQGPEDGTLRLVPSARGIAYILIRALQDDVADDDLCGALPGRALSVSPEWHQTLLDGLVSIPLVEPGDTVWWHQDVVHAVGDEHHGKDYASVIYIGATPKCAKNEAYARKQAASFAQGNSAPDFAAENYEVDFKGRATVDDLTALGRKQMAIS
ncbi:MAG: YbiU family protein [Pseudomonadota bacterium]